MKSFLKKRAFFFISIPVITFVILISVYIGLIKIYEDFTISLQNPSALVQNISVTGRTVFNDERLLISQADSNYSVEANYFKNIYIKLKETEPTVIDTIVIFINGNGYSVYINKPDFSKNGYQYFDVQYSTNKSLTTKIKYIVKCNFIHISDKFKYSISLIILFLLPLYILLFVIFFRIKKSLKKAKES